MSKVIRSIHRSQRGFTLAEILVTTAIFAIIMLAALAVYDRSNQTFKQGTESADLQQSTRIGFDKLVSDVRMAGFDYSRGGIPTETWQAPQPDEQVEYAGPTALVFRANFNYNSASANGNGLEPTFTPVNVQGQSIFPYVTTSNSEIIAYVLRSTNAAANTGSISFWADTYQPRSAFPSSITPAPAAANPSHPERQVVINGIDVTNNNPPYTLYRVTVADVLAGSLGTPVAENIRSLNFQYYTDFSGTTLLTNSDGTAITAARNSDGSTLATTNSGAIGGDGQFDPNASGGIGGGSFTDRAQRALISAIRVSLVGMNANPDLQGYTNPTETISSIKSYRQYALSSVVVPRNLGLTGFPEPSYNPPSPPTITGICTGFCGAPVIYWQPPSTGNVIKYHIEWDSNMNGAFPPNQGFDVNDPTATSAVFLDDGTSDVSLPRFYRMEAVNDNGQSAPSQVMQATPLNNTKPMPPTITGVNGGANAITLTWTAPTQNAPGSDILACSGTGGSTSGTAIPTQELIEFRVYRGTTPTFTPAQGVMVLDYNNPGGQQIPVSPGAPVTWVDSPGTSLSPPAPCINYYYRVQAIDRCAFSVGGHSQNTPTSQGSISDPSPAVASLAAGPAQSTTAVAPSPVGGLLIDHSLCSNNVNVTLDVPNGTCGPNGSGLPNLNWYIGLQWPKVTTDTAGRTTAIDTYRITRSRRPQSIGGPFVLDPTWVPTDVSGFSQTSGGTCYWQDRNSNYLPGVPYADPGVVTGPWEYQYTVAAKACLIYSAESNAAIFPGCTTSVSIDPIGGLGAGSGTGDTPAGPWVMDASNSVQVTPGVNVTLNSVRFDLYTYPGGVLVGSATAAPPTAPPFQFPWTDTASATYQLWMTITDSNNCTEVHLKYIRQEDQAACVFANVPGIASILSGHPSADEHDAVTYTIINTNPIGGDDLRFNIDTGVGSPFHSPAAIQWSSSLAQTYPDLQLTAIVWSWDNTLQGGLSGSVTQTICAFGSCPQPGAVAISTLTSAGTTATATTSAAHGYTTGTVVRILGATPATYNGMYTITVLNPTQFTYTFAGGTSPAAGTKGASKVLTLNQIVPPLPNVPDIKANGGKLTIRLQYEFDGRGSTPSLNQTPPLPNVPVLKFCLPYKINGDLTRIQKCNVAGQNVAPLTTANPASCD